MSSPDSNPLDFLYSDDKDYNPAPMYDAWAAQYEDDLRAIGYAAPTRCAEALAAADPTLSGPVVDLGCGSGLSGAALAAVGFTVIDGYDFSEGMLALAREKGCYRDVVYKDLSQPNAVPDRGYKHAVLVGVLSPAHAPPEALIAALALLPKDGCVVFTLNDDALKYPEYVDCVTGLIEGGTVELVSDTYGPHLPARGVQAKVYVLKKT